MRHSVSYIASLATLVAAAAAHVSMVSPCVRYTPFCSTCPQLPAGASVDTNINAPIGTHEKVNQPLCKFTTPYSKPAAQWTAGSTVTVEFNPHAAVHGGGHCQFSLSYDGGKTFVVIHDELRYCFTGGPSGSNSAANLAYSIPLPNNLPSGDHVIFAWSWNNAIGNREYYMNCADVSIKGAGSGSFTGPQMLVANYGPDSPFIPEFNGNYETGIDLFKSRKMITVTGSGGYSSSANSSVTIPPPSPSSAAGNAPAGSMLGAGSPGTGALLASPASTAPAYNGGAGSQPAAAAAAASQPVSSASYGSSAAPASPARSNSQGAATYSAATAVAPAATPAYSPSVPTGSGPAANAGYSVATSSAPATMVPPSLPTATPAPASPIPSPAYHARLVPITSADTNADAAGDYSAGDASAVYSTAPSASIIPPTTSSSRTHPKCAR
ncbi:hypothetical protein GGI12_005282 [Dipsacomyces acuminosporus]|nr:hypothetical protein GGI12_005282 [Dipsacomyces acuminosporus]